MPMMHRPMVLMLIGVPRRLRMDCFRLKSGMILANGNRLADQPFNRLEIGNFFGIAERQCDATRAGTCRAPDAMNVRLRLIG